MLLTVTLESDSAANIDASDISFLLRKHPGRVQTFDTPAAKAHVFYPEVSHERTTVAMLLEVDAIDLVRSKKFRGNAEELSHYVNDRPFVASSLMSVALGRVFRSAMSGASDTHPQLASLPLPLQIRIPVVARGGGENDLVERLFAPLGWDVDAGAIALDEAYPEWGNSRYCSLSLAGRVRLSEALRHLYVLLPVLDDAKHYWVGTDEATKLIRQGEGWLADHPERELILQRYLAHQRSLVSLAEASFGVEEMEHKDITNVALRDLRAEAVIRALKDAGAHRVIDMGAGPGALLRRLQNDQFFTEIVGVDVSARSLQKAQSRLNLAEASDIERSRITLLHGSAIYRDDRLKGFDAMVLMEVIEHIEVSRLSALEDSVFGFSRPSSVIVTTPNREYNQVFGMPDGVMRHEDHRFEWSRAEFEKWAKKVADKNGYVVDFRPVGSPNPNFGAPTQLALFERNDA